MSNTLKTEDILNWDAYIKTPPPRKSGTVKVKLKYIGRSKPKAIMADNSG